MKTRRFFRILSLVVISTITAIACEGIIEEPHIPTPPPDPEPETPSYTITVTPGGTVDIPAEGGSQEFSIKTNAPYYGYSFPKRDWMKASIDTDRMVIVINFTVNDSGAERSNEVTFYGKEKNADEYLVTQKVTVVQPAKSSGTDNPGGGPDNPGENAISVNIDFGDSSLSAQGCEVLTAMGAYAAGSSSASVDMLDNADVPQIAMLCNQSGDVLLVSRDLCSSGAGITLDVRSSALAYVTLHPLFGLVHDKDGFEQLKEAIVGAPSFNSFEQKVASVIKSGKPLFDPSNTSFNKALETLLDEVYYSQEKPTKATNVAGLEGEGDFKVGVDGKRISIYPYYLSPMYSGAILDCYENQVAEFNIPAGSSYGVTDVFYRESMKYGDPVVFDFSGFRPSYEGEYLFRFSRDTEDARLDYFIRCLSDQLDILGCLPSEATMTIKDFLMTTTSWTTVSLADDDAISLQEVSELVYTLTIEFLRTDKAAKLYGSKARVLDMVNKVYVAQKVYTGLRGTANQMTRIYFYARCPHEISFCLCNVGTLPLYPCSYVTLEAISGDGQEGHTNEMLDEELVVRVNPGNNDNPPPYYLVAFKVKSGGGSLTEHIVMTDANLKAATRWKLGPESEHQIVTVEVLDPTSHGVISKNTVTFYATNTDLSKEIARELRGVWRVSSEEVHKKPVKIILGKSAATFEDPSNPQRNVTGMPVWSEAVYDDDGTLKYYNIYRDDADKTLFLGHVTRTSITGIGNVMDVRNVWNYYQNRRFILEDTIGAPYYVSLLCEFTNKIGQHGRISMYGNGENGAALSVTKLNSTDYKVKLTGKGNNEGEECTFSIVEDNDIGYVVKDFHYVYNYSFVYDSSTNPVTREEVHIECSIDIMTLTNMYAGAAWFDPDEKSSISYTKSHQLFPEDDAFFVKQEGETMGDNVFSIEIYYR